MTEFKIEFPEVVGKSVAELFVVEDADFGREVLIRFSDETQLSIAIGVRQVTDARYCNQETPDFPISQKQSE